MANQTSMTATATSWDETTYEELPDGGKLTKAAFHQNFTGGLEGEGVAETLMCYAPDGTARFTGQQFVSGKLEGRSGGFVLQTDGEYDGAGIRAKWSVVPNSGSGELRGLRGHGTSQATGMEVAMTFDYEFD